MIWCIYFLHRLQLGQREVLALIKFQLSVGVLRKSLMNSLYVREATHWDATRKVFPQKHHHHLPTSLTTVNTILMLSLWSGYELYVRFLYVYHTSVYTHALIFETCAPLKCSITKLFCWSLISYIFVNTALQNFMY